MKSKILLIDDSPLFLMLTKLALPENEFEVRQSSHAEEGLNIVREWRPDLVITDVLMPSMDGYEFLKCLRNDRSCGDTRVLFYTGTFSGLDEVALARAGGVIATLAKPAEPEEIVRAVREALLQPPAPATELNSDFEREHLRILTNHLSQKAAEFQALSDCIPQLIWRCRPDGFIEHANLRWHQFHGLASHALSLEEWSSLIHAQDRERVTKIIRAAFAGANEVDCEARLLRADGSYIHCLISGQAAPNPEDKKISWFFSGTDISAKKAYETRLLELKEKAEALARAKTEFLNNISHEIRTPLNIIAGFSEILGDEIPGLKTHPLFERMCANTLRLTQVLNEIITLSELQASGARPPSEDVRLPDFLSRLEFEFQKEAGSKGIDFKCAHNLGTAVQLQSHPQVLRLILHHLFENALKFTTSGTITFRASVLKNAVQFEVEDTGVGISEADRSRLFKAFSQLDGSLTRKTGGLGLGLLLARNLSEAIGGKVDLLRSEPGSGSCFRLTAPIFDAN